MSVFLAILGLCSTLAPLLVRWIQRKWVANADPNIQRQILKEKTDEQIAKGKAGIDDLNMSMDDLLNRTKSNGVPRTPSSDISRQGDKVP